MSVVDVLNADGVESDGTRQTEVRFEDVYAAHARAVYTYLCFQTGDTETADDLLSVVFERVLIGLPRYSAARGPLKPWLYAIVRNTLRNQRRSKARSRVTRLDRADAVASLSAGPEEAAVERERQRELVTAVSRLRDRDRDVIGLKFSGGMSNGSIARVLGVREGHVAVILHRAVERLRKEIESGGQS